MRRVIRKASLLLLGVLVLLLLLLGLFRSRYIPVLCQLARAQAKTAALSLIDEAILSQIEKGEIRYDRIIYFEKDTAGRITALKTNMQEINRLKALILELINRKVLDLDESRLGVSLGNLLFPEFRPSLGPVIPVHILSVRSSNAAFTSQFSQAGINQTLHQIRMSVEISGTILVLGKIQTFSVSSNVMVAETVIVGQVPNSFS